MTLLDAHFGQRVRYGQLDAQIIDINQHTCRAQIRILVGDGQRRVLWVGLCWIEPVEKNA